MKSENSATFLYFFFINCHCLIFHPLFLSGFSLVVFFQGGGLKYFNVRLRNALLRVSIISGKLKSTKKKFRYFFGKVVSRFRTINLPSEVYPSICPYNSVRNYLMHLFFRTTPSVLCNDLISFSTSLFNQLSVYKSSVSMSKFECR